MKAEEPSGRILFEEKQRFPKWLSVLIVSIVLLTMIGMIVMGILLESERDEAIIGMAIAIPIEAVVIYLFLNSRLDTVVTSNGFYYRWKPLHRKYRVIEKEKISKLEKRDAPTLNYGAGWFPGYGRFYNVSKGKGIQFYLAGGKKLFISSTEVERFGAALQDMTGSNRKTQIREF